MHIFLIFVNRGGYLVECQYVNMDNFLLLQGPVFSRSVLRFLLSGSFEDIPISREDMQKENIFSYFFRFFKK